MIKPELRATNATSPNLYGGGEIVTTRASVNSSENWVNWWKDGEMGKWGDNTAGLSILN